MTLKDEPVHDELDHNDTPIILGSIFLPANPGTPVGRFDFIVDRETGNDVEIGTPVAADTLEGTIIGTIVDMRTVGRGSDPVGFDLGGSYDQSYIATVSEVVVATVQVFHAPALRSVRAGLVRAATAKELLVATGYDRIDWPIPAGVIPLAGGTYAKVCHDGHALLGPESAHLMIGGLSGQAAKTSYAGVLLRAALDAGSKEKDSVGAIIFNVKGTDLLFLDEKPAAGYELSDEDTAMYEALGVPATPFPDVTVYAPSLPGGGGTRSPRDDAARLRWDLTMIWPYLKYFFPWMYEDDKLSGFVSHFEDLCLRNRNPSARIDTFAKLDAFFNREITEAEETKNDYCWGNRVHIATMRKLRRMLTSLPTRGGGLIGQETSTAADDVPVKGWVHGQVIVVDVAGLHTEVQAVVIARVCERLLRSAEDGELGIDHLVVFADELNSFAPAQGGEMGAVKRILQRVSSQGRYAGISLWGAGQKLSKIDEMVRDNASTRTLGITTDGELSSGIYGKLAGGLAERIATLPKGQMALWAYNFRSALVVHFPRPAWKTGRPKTLAGRPSTMSVLRDEGKVLSQEARDRLLEGIPDDIAEQVVAGADDVDEATRRLAAIRVPDMVKVALHEPSSFDPDDPFDLGD